MNVYLAIAKSPVGVAMHEKGSAVDEEFSRLEPWDEQYPDGWQPLYNGDEVEQWKQRAEKSEAQLYEACQQLAGEYTLGKPLKKAKNGKRYIAIHKETGEILQGQFIWTGPIQGKTYTYYADPRPWPKLPEKKPRYKAERGDGCYWCVYRDGERYATLNNQSDAEGLAILLNESEGE